MNTPGMKTCPCGCGREIPEERLMCWERWRNAPRSLTSLLGHMNRGIRAQAVEDLIRWAKAQWKKEEGIRNGAQGTARPTSKYAQCLECWQRSKTGPGMAEVLRVLDAIGAGEEPWRGLSREAREILLGRLKRAAVTVRAQKDDTSPTSDFEGASQD